MGDEYEDKLEYVAPEIIYEMDMETRAGSPMTEPSPLDDLLQP